jgi:hypothetical protein
VPEEPEEVLPEQRVAAFRRIEELCPDQAIRDQGRARDHHRRHGEEHHEGGDEKPPHEERYPVERHAGRALLHDRGDELNRYGDRRHFGEGDHLRPDVGALARGIFRSGKRHVGEPADIRADIEEERDEQHRAAEEVEPVGVVAEPREGDLPRSHHERHEIVAHALHDRHGEEKHHGRAMGREELIVGVGPDQRILRNGELDAHRERQRSG